MSEVLNPLTLPLRGSQLIEASAGTGKTWTIAALYLRLVVGHGCTPLTPGEILVMTFTKAATRELSDRIRKRLVRAAAVFRGDAAPGADDYLAALLAAFPAAADRQLAAWRLATAADAMDDAAVHTIDAWCQRMLREHAFDSGCLFDEELQAQESAIVAEAVRDYWRQNVYPLNDAALQSALAVWKDIDALAADVEKLIGMPVPPTAGEGSLADVVARVEQQQRDQFALLKAGWAHRADAMLAWLAPIWADKKHAARKALPGEANARRWIAALKEWAIDAVAIEPLDLKAGADRLSYREIQAKFEAAGVSMHVPACFAEFDALMADLGSLPVGGSALRLHAAACVIERMHRIKALAGTYGFADMLTRLDAALDESARGAKAQRLRQRIVAQYPVALIDEFQDTSPVQLSIFDRLYRIADNDPSHALLLIGDPKQAIYGFRGADIYSYLRARNATQGRHHVLATNHRSTQALVHAVNAMFLAAETRPGAGAFMFREPGSAPALPFVEVQAAGRAERLVASTGSVPAVTMVVDEPLRNKEDSRKLFAALCAEAIVGLLNDPNAGFEQEGEPFKRLQPADIAVLVRSGTEADAVRKEMRRRGLASVYLSDKDTVFQTPEAADLLRLLQAVAAPRDMRLARAALATTLLGFTLPELVALSTNDELFDRQCERLQQLNQVWKGQGVLAMVRRALHAFDLPSRWLAPQDPMLQGERRLTNVLHLAELLQAASAQANGEQAQVRWLLQQIADGSEGRRGGDEVVLRLESDADLVKVVTVHKSKGLEYPVVFLPFPAHFLEVVSAGESREKTVLLLPGTDGVEGHRDLVLSPSKTQLAAQEREQQREALRLLYVAVTRARHALWIGLSGLQAGVAKSYLWHRSGIGYLLSGGETRAPEQRLADISALAHACADVAVEPLRSSEDLPWPAATPLRPRAGVPALLPAPVYTAQFERDWGISSYSALVRDAAWGPAASGALPALAVLDDEPDDSDGAATSRRGSDQPWHRFPRGALAGNFLHDQLEWLAEEHFALDSSPALQKALVRRCELQGWGHRADDVLIWLRKVCTTPLPALGMPLDALPSIAPEMEFWIPSDGMSARRVDELSCKHMLAARPRPQLPERALKGMLMGFADLVVECEGRFFVVDYKSNALGLHDADYTPEAMHAAMLEHRYDVQAALYLLALHRLLKARLGAAYEPARHLGGAIYLFLRGINSANAGCCHLAAPLALLADLDAMLPQGTAATAQASA
jgi:exodeoxyribonuclease V beta subunit